MIEMLMSRKELLTVGELASFLRVSQMTIYRMVKSNSVPTVRFRNNIRFDPRAIAKWVQTSR